MREGDRTYNDNVFMDGDTLVIGGRRSYTPSPGYESTARETRRVIGQDARLTRTELDVFASSNLKLRWIIGRLDPNASADPKAPYMPADWFRLKFGISATRISAARRTIVHKLDGQLNRLEAALGLSPAARARLTVSEEPVQDETTAKYFKRSRSRS